MKNNMEVNLNVKDRLTLITILPTQGKITELVEVMDLVRLIRLTEEEKSEINYKEVDGRVLWDATKEAPRDFNISFEQVKIIKDSVKKLDDDGKVNLAILDTCLKFSKL